VAVELTTHHFTLTDEAVGEYDTNAKMNPPLRQPEDVAALIAALRDGSIDAIASDHAPHHRDEKDVEFECAAHGIVGLETALALSLTLVREHGLDIDTLVRVMSVNPARILRVPGGSLAVGAPADVCIFDPDLYWRVEAAALKSQGKNTPFIGLEVRGKVRATLVAGRIVHEA